MSSLERSEEVQTYLDLVHGASLMVLKHVMSDQELTGDEKATLLLEMSSAHMRLFEFINTRLQKKGAVSSSEISQEIQTDVRFQ